MADVPTHKMSIDALITITPYLADVYKYIDTHIYLWQMYPPNQLSRNALNIITSYLADLYIYRQCTYTYGRCTPTINLAEMT